MYMMPHAPHSHDPYSAIYRQKKKKYIDQKRKKNVLDTSRAAALPI